MAGCGWECRTCEYDTKTGGKVGLTGRPGYRVRALSCAGARFPNPDPIFVHQKSSIRRLLDDERSWVGLFVITAAVATAICVARVCNNFLIFRAAFDHLVSGADMYVLHPTEHGDLYKYSPTFALAFAPFRAIPYAPSLFIWNLLNVLLIYWGLRLVLAPGERLAAVALTALGLVTTLDGTQSNGLVAATIILAFAALERNRLWLGAGAIVAGILIKLFPAAALAFAVPRKDRVRFGVVFAVVMVALVAVPLVVTPAGTLVDQYRSWYAMGSVDALDRGASVMRLLHILFGYDGPNWPVQVAGTAMLILPLLRGRWSDPQHRKLFLASLLVWSVIFNHKAEQPSFVIAVVGVAIWYAVRARSLTRDVLAGAVLVATVPVLLAVAIPWLPGGIMPPLLVTAGACTVVWLGIQAELLDLAPERAPAAAQPLMRAAD